MFQSVYMYL